MNLENSQIAENNRMSGIRNLQTNHRNHPDVGNIIRRSEDNWLSASDVYSILSHRESLTVSTNQNPRRGVEGLYLFYCHRFLNYRNGFVGTRRFTRRHGEHTIRVTQSRPLRPVAPTYSRRLHRCYPRFVLVHYRIV
uniref:Uncharacterized protein n=2 Tax=Brassica campestris TaxID=3711 RepID=M4CC20_BRACM|nr:unnamed protein product [Brassica rapa]